MLPLTGSYGGLYINCRGVASITHLRTCITSWSKMKTSNSITVKTLQRWSFGGLRPSMALARTLP